MKVAQRTRRGQYFQVSTVLLLLFLTTISGCDNDKGERRLVESHTGRIVGYDYDEFVLKLVAGEQLTANLNTARLDVIVYSPAYADLRNGEPYVVKTTGDQTPQLVLDVL